MLDYEVIYCGSIFGAQYGKYIVTGILEKYTYQKYTLVLRSATNINSYQFSFPFKDEYNNSNFKLA